MLLKYVLLKWTEYDGYKKQQTKNTEKNTTFYDIIVN